MNFYSELVAGLPKTENRQKWTIDQQSNVSILEEIISEYSYGDQAVDDAFFYLSMFTDIFGEFSLTSTEYTKYPGDC